MNFIEDVLERFPAAKPALIEVDAEGGRRLHHFGELFARSAGLSGAFAARGVRRGDVVMTLLGNRPEWVLALLACWRMGAVALPCNPQLRRKDLELRAGAADPAARRRRGALPGRAARRHPLHGHGRPGRVLDEDRDQETPAAVEDLAAEDPAAIVFTSGTTGEPRGVVYPQRYLTGQRLQAEHWFGAGEGEVAWCTAAPGWSKSTRNAFIAPWLTRRRRGAPRRPLRPRRAAATLRRARRQRPLPGADRVPDAGRAQRSCARSPRCAAWSRPGSRSSPR